METNVANFYRARLTGTDRLTFAPTAPRGITVNEGNPVEFIESFRRFCGTAGIVHQRRLKIMRNFSLAQLARRAGVDPSFVNGIERGSHAPEMGTANALYKALGGYGLCYLFFDAADARASSKSVLVPDMNEPHRVIGKFVKEWRESKGYTMGKMSELMGMHQSDVGIFEAGREPTKLPTLQKRFGNIGISVVLYGIQ